MPGQDRLGYYVAQYDGEIAAVDEEVGRRSWTRSAASAGGGTHGGGADLRPRREPGRARLLLRPRRGPLRSLPGHPADRARAGRAGGRRAAGAGLHARPRARRSSTRSRCRIRPTWPGPACCPRSRAARRPGRERLFAQNDRNLTRDLRRALQARGHAARRRDAAARPSTTARRDPGETRDVARAAAGGAAASRAASWSCSWSAPEREWARTRALVQGKRRASRTPTAEACEKLRALGYVRARGP